MIDDEIIVRLVDLPTSVKGLTAIAEDGSINVYINARLNDIQRRRELRHELKHVKRRDAYNDLSIRQVEKNK